MVIVMKFLRKIFGQVRMTWPKVFIFAVITAAYTALINQVPFLYDTSFQDIAIRYECWIIFALFIVTNCDKWWDAALKCFVFFLISQPLIFLIEVPFSNEGFGLFRYYKQWFYITLLTLPGGAVAYLVKRRDLIATVVLSVATAFMSYLCIYYLDMTAHNFPNHLLSCIFCAVASVLLVFVMIDSVRNRAMACAVIVIALVVSYILLGVHLSKGTAVIELGDGSWSYVLDDDSVASVSIDEEGNATVTEEKKGSTMLTFTDSEGNVREYLVTVSGGDVLLGTF